MGSIKGWVVGIGGVVACVLGLVAYGRAHWAQATQKLLVLLESGLTTPA